MGILFSTDNIRGIAESPFMAARYKIPSPASPDLSNRGVAPFRMDLHNHHISYNYTCRQLRQGADNPFPPQAAKKTPTGKGGKEPVGEKEEMLQQNANMGQQIILSCHLLYVVIHFYLSHFRANRQINIF